MLKLLSSGLTLTLILLFCFFFRLPLLLNVFYFRETLHRTTARLFICVVLFYLRRLRFCPTVCPSSILSSRIFLFFLSRLPLLLNVFYFRETLFIVYELLRDNLYHIYKYIEECKLPRCTHAFKYTHTCNRCERYRAFSIPPILSFTCLSL